MGKVNFIKVSCCDSDFSHAINISLEAFALNFTLGISSDEQSVQRLKEIIVITTAAYAASFEILLHGISKDDNVQRYKKYLDTRLEIEFLTKRPETTEQVVQWVYDVNSEVVFHQHG